MSVLNELANFFGNRRDRSPQLIRSRRRRRDPRRSAFHLEELENRMLLSVTLFGIPDWLEQGPMPTIDGQVSASPDDAVSGAIEALAAHPTNADVLYAGGALSGVWKTTNATSDTPNWTPLTDQYPSLAISDLAFSPLDATNNTLFAGTGGFTNGGFNGPAVGLLRTTDGGTTWEQLGTTTFANDRIRSVVPTAIGTSLADQVVLVASIDGGGVYRSGDGGDNFTIVSGTSGTTDGLDNDSDGSTDELGELNLPNGDASYLAPDPGDANRFYAAIRSQGIFRSDDAGASWVQVNNGLAGIGAAQNIELSVSAAAGNPVYAGFISGGVLANVFRSGDQGANWAPIGVAPAITPGGQGFNDFSMIADRVDPNGVYVGGDRQAASPFVGNMFRGDAPSGNWTDITDVLTTLFSAPHADSRDMVYDASGSLLEADDGGIFRFTEVLPAIGVWTNHNRNLGVAEFYSAPYDHITDTIFGGTQDTGSPGQQSPGSGTWDEFNQGDGGSADAGYFEFLGSDFSVKYTMGNNFNTFERRFSALPFTLLNGQLGLGGLDAADTGFTGFTVFPYEANELNGARLVIGGTNNLYESTDFGDNLAIITPGGTNGVSALAYGGRSGGVDNEDLIYAGIGGNLWLRTTSGGAFSQLTAYPGNAPRDIGLDPDDWQNVYVTDGTGVFHSDDAGATWTAVNTPGLTAFTSGLNTVEVFGDTAAAGDEVVLVGSANGVFRSRNPGAGAAATWGEFGGDLPNAPVTDLTYDATDDVLVAGTFGRGAWLIANASDFIPVPGVIQIDGDTDFPGQDDVILLIRDENNNSMLEVFLNNNTDVPDVTIPIASVDQINVNGLGGNDTLILDSSFGLISVPLGTRYDGGPGRDNLQLLQTDGPTHVSDTYSIGNAGGSGISAIVGGTGAGTQTVFFEALSPVLDLVPVASLAVNATPSNNAITYGAGSLVTRGLITLDEHESIEFASKTTVAINAGAGTDTVSLNNSSTPTGLTAITVNGGEPNSGDALVVTGVGLAVTVDTGAGTISGATGAAGAVGITYTTFESVSLPSGIGALTLTTTGADDTVVVTPGASPAGSNNGTLTSSVLPLLTFANVGAFTANLGAGMDTLVVNGSAAADTIAMSGVAVAITGRHAVNHSGVQFLTVNGLGGPDTFTATPSGTVGMFVDGGDPIGVSPGDSLTIAAGGGAVTLNSGPESDEGSLAVTGALPVSFDHVESVAVSASGGVTIAGTTGPDAIAVVARDGSTHSSANGVQDFTVGVNGGPAVLFLDAPTLLVDAVDGSDDIALRAPAPNNAVWNVQVTLAGGPPRASDSVIVETPGAAAETAVYTPTAVDGGTLDLTSLTSLVTLTGIEHVVYDGLGDGDTLTIVATGGADTVVHTPGPGGQAGSFRVNSLLALGYQNLGGAGSLTVDGGSGDDTLVMYGTAVNDTFTVAASGAIALNAQPAINTSSIQTLTLEGLDGDDTFTLLAAVSGSPYPVVNLNGGAQASAAGDRVNLIGTAGADTFIVNGSQLTGAAVVINQNGIEDTRVDAQGGADVLVYNGVSGVVEAIRIAASEVAGGGQLSVPGTVRVTFTSLETFDVNGNVGVGGDEDTLTFTGTNAAEVFEIDLAAAGTDADPILKLFKSGTTQLTLRNYTNFNTLQVEGLDGTDTFNVFTAPVTPVNRNLFVDGGLPAGKKRETDQLNIFYTPPRPRIIHSAATQDPDAGLVDLDYGTARFVVQYDGVEDFVIRRLS